MTGLGNATSVATAPDLAALTGLPLPTVTRTCEDVLASRLLVVAGRAYAFAYDITREVLYRTTPEPSRVAYHGRAADLMSDRPEVMARHAAAALHADWKIKHCGPLDRGG